MIKVDDISCKHCVATIKGGLKTNNIKGKVDLKTKTVTVDNLEEDKAIEVIKELGYNPIKA